MRIRTAALLLAFSLPTFAAQEATEASAEVALPAARTILDAHLEKSGFGKALATAKSIRKTGTVEVVGMGMKGRIEVLNAKPDLLRTKVELEGFGEMLSGFDGKIAWHIHPMMGAGVLEDLERYQQVRKADFDTLLKKDEDYESIETVERVEFNGQTCWKLELVAKVEEGMDAEKSEAVRTTVEYYDVETGLLAGSETTHESPMGSMTMVATASDYKKMGECLVATQLTQKAPMQQTKIVIESLVFEDEVDAEAFTPPKEILALLEH